MTRKLSIVMVSAGFWPTIGGAEKQALELSATLVKKGHHVTVLTRRLPQLKGREMIQGINVIRLPAFGTAVVNASFFMCGCFLWLLSHALQWDAVHVHLAGSPALAASLAGRIVGKPVIVKLGGGRGIGELATSSKTAMGRLKLRLLGKLNPHFLAVVPDLADEAAQFLGPVNIEILPNGVDVNRFHPVDLAQKKILREKFGLSTGALTFIYTGRFSPEKRLPWFLKHWLKAAEGKAQIIFIGDGTEGALLRAEQNRFPKQIHVLSPQDNLQDYYAASDVFILPSISEGLSNSLLEAMASGLTPLASKVGGTAQTVQDGVTGLLFDRDDEAGLHNAINRLIKEEGLSWSLGMAARVKIESNYSLDQVTRRLEQIYHHR